MRRLFLALVPALAVVLMAASPSYAFSRLLTHYDPDGGYAPPIIYTCDWSAGTHANLYTGHSSPCNAEGIYVRSGEEVWCRETRLTPWVKRFDATGWHKTSYWDTAGCTLRVD